MFRRLILTAVLLSSNFLPLFAFDNVLLVTIDTLRADYVSAYGSQKVHTPNIDSVAAEGVLFRVAVSSVPLTLPSHVSIFTGLIPPVHQVRDNGGFVLNQRVTTLTEILKVHGMHTAAFIGSFSLDSRFGLAQGFDIYDENYPTTATKVTMPERRAEDVANAALKWLSSNKGPWFVWVHFFDPHFPYQPPVEFQKKYPGDLYAGEVAYADQQLGRLLEFLKQNHLDKTTLIVITSDHGESLGEHGEKTHGIFGYESTLHVPLILAPMNHGSIETRVRLIDVAPTILELQHLHFGSKIQGLSLVPLLNGKTLPPSDSYFEAMAMNLSSGWAPLTGFYSGNHKYIKLPVPELYDLDSDRHETKNLCGNHDLCEQWAQRFGTFSSGINQLLPKPSRVDEETAERLKALGYTSPGTGNQKNKFGPADDPKNLIAVQTDEQTALSYLENGDHEKAINALKALLVKHPRYAPAYLDAAMIESSLGDPATAAISLEDAHKHGISSPSLDALLGLYLSQSGQKEQAIQELQKAVASFPDCVECWNNLGITYSSSGRVADARAAFENSRKIDPSNAVALTNLGVLDLAEQKYDLAIQNLQQALSRKADDTAYTALGIAYAQKEDWSNAIRAWEEGLNANPKNFDLMWNLALTYQKRNPKRARELLLEFQSSAPQQKYKEHLMKIPSLLRQLP
ncbi:MAG: hypothetical protein C5B54_03740 [Acidobacteria bacterium]|nr:MAG: hypothetical protein C5B54_03740 [Acidobacteriota bacterium]